MPKNETNIDLQCSLCPKNPKFSDVSHLLTHISSKGHLAQRFQLEFRSKSEREAKDKLNTFESWYRRSNLDTLLSNRLAAKDQKKASKDKKSRASTAGVKKEKTAPKNTTDPLLAAAPVFRAPVPAMHHWSTTTATASTAAGGSEWPSNPGYTSPYATRPGYTSPYAPRPGYTSPYTTPTSRREVPNFTSEQTAADIQVDPKLMTPKKQDQIGEEEMAKTGESPSYTTDLKGVKYPGMGKFDSATPEGIRMRNQRKDGSILEQMLATSIETEPAEISYHANGEFRASRNIYGPLSTENTPEPSPKKRKTRKTAALSNVSTNVPRARAPRKKKAAALGSPEKRATAMQPQPQVLLRPPPTLNPFINPFAVDFGGVPFATIGEEGEEFRMTFGNKKKNFNIFQDAPELQAEVSPGRTESPLEEHRFDFPTHSLPSYPNNSINASHIPPSPTPVAKPLSFRNFGKENMQPEMSTGQGFPQQPRPQPPTSQFYNSSSPQSMNPYGSGAPYNPLYNHAYARAKAYGAYGRGPFAENRAPSGIGSNFNGDFKPVAAPSTAGPQQHPGQTIGFRSNLGTALQFAL